MHMWFREQQKELGLKNKDMAEHLGFSEKHIEQLRSGYKSVAKHTVLHIEALIALKQNNIKIGE